MDDLLTRLSNHIAMMAPHQKDRYTGKLIIEARNEIERLHKQVQLLTAERDGARAERNHYMSRLPTIG